MQEKITRNPKSATIAGVLALVLGIFGAHDWYLNDRKKARIHVILAITTVIAFILDNTLQLLIQSVSSIALAQTLSSLASIMRLVGWATLLGNVIWALIDGVLLLLQGDAGLAEKGFTIMQKPTQSTSPQNAPTSVQASPAATFPSQSHPTTAAPTAQASQSTAVAAAQVAPSPSVSHPTTVDAATPPPLPSVQSASANLVSQSVAYHSANIQQPSQPQLLDEILSSKDVETPALVYQDSTGKSTINPVILKRALITIASVVGVIIAVFLVKASIDSAFSAGYGDAYRIAKEIMPSFTAAAKSSSCQYAVDYVKSAYVDKTNYDGYIDTCRSLATSDGELIEKLGQTGAMRWDSAIAAQYQDFKTRYDDLFANGEKTNQMLQALDLYQIWHNYVLATDILTVNSSEAAFQEAADILRKSGNSVLSRYGDDWYYREMEYINLYQTYWDMSYTDPEKESTKLAAETMHDDLKNWVDEHRPNILTLAPFDVPDLTPAYNSFTQLYNLIRTGYEKHYDTKSGDCQKAGKQVYCS